MANPSEKARPILVADGWRKRSGPFYTRPLAPGVVGVLGLGPERGLPYQWRMRPSVGVDHERINGVARALVGTTGTIRYPQRTISYPLVKLLEGPEARELDRWLIATEAVDGNERVFREVADAIRNVALPWLSKRTSVDAIIYELKGGNAHGRCTPRLTAALWIKGEVAAAERQLQLIESQFGRPAPKIPEPLRGLRVTSFGSTAPPEGWPRPAFDAFAARLRQAMAQYPTGPPDHWPPAPHEQTTQA